MLGASLFMGILAYIASPSVLKLAGTPENIMADAVIYMQVSCIGVPLIAASILNVILDILFVSVFKKGIYGYEPDRDAGASALWQLMYRARNIRGTELRCGQD